MLGDWRERVPDWWARYSNDHYPKAKWQIAEFQARFPWQALPSITIDRLGRVSGQRDTLTYALIWGTKGVVDLGRVNDLGLWLEEGEWHTSTSETPEAAFARIRDGLYELATMASEARWGEIDERGRELFGGATSLRVKPLYLWFPESLAPSVKWEHMGRILNLLGRETPDESLIVRNRRLWQALRDEPVFRDFGGEALPPTHFFYWDAETKPYLMNGEGSPQPSIPAPPTAMAPTAHPPSAALLRRLRAEKNVVLTGPPGTGKTWLAQRVVEAIRFQPEGGAPATPIATTWKDALALALYEIGTPAKVPAIIAHPAVRAMVETTGKATANLNSTAAIFLAEHTPPASSVATASRHPPALFDRNEDKAWFLIPEGVEYVEQVLLAEPARPPRRVEFVAFHPSFGYEEFVEGIRPVLDDEAEGTLRYEVRPGPFLRMADAAKRAWEAQGADAPEFLVVVDEINRADVARTFGDLLPLLEKSKRLGSADALETTLPYSGRRLVLPPNLLLLATMNTSDRSVALMDLALRRRFAFVECAPDPSVLGTVAGVDLARLLQTLNEGIAALTGPDLTLGHAFLLGVRDAEGLDAAWRDRVLPQLAETFHGRANDLEALLGPAFFADAPLPQRLETFLGERPRRLRNLEGADLQGALRSVYGE